MPTPSGSTSRDDAPRTPPGASGDESLSATVERVLELHAELHSDLDRFVRGARRPRPQDAEQRPSPPRGRGQLRRRCSPVERAVATKLAALLEGEQRAREESIRRGERELAEMGRQLARITLFRRHGRRGWLAGCAVQVRRERRVSVARRRGSRRATGSGTRAGPDGDSDSSDPPGDAEAPPAGRQLAEPVPIGGAA